MHAQRHGGLVLTDINRADAALEAFRNIRGGVHGKDERAGLKGGETHEQHKRDAEIHHKDLNQQRHAAEDGRVEEREPLQQPKG